MIDKNYTPFFCEENIWHLVSGLSDSVRKKTNVLFLTNKNRSIAVMNQKAAPPGEFIIWDYHVVLHSLDENLIYDFDTRLGSKTEIIKYFLLTFGEQSYIMPKYRTDILVIPANQYLDGFYSDRSHMLDKNGNRLKPFPSTPPILSGDQFSLMDLVHSKKKVCNQFKIYTPVSYLQLNGE